MIYKYQARDRSVAMRYAAEDLGVGIDGLDVVPIKKKLMVQGGKRLW